MTTEAHDESSVLFSLEELARLEDVRIAEEQRQLAAARARRERERDRAAAELHALEQTRRAQEEAERHARRQQQAEADARAQAREQMALEQARIKSEADAALAARKLEQQHELETMKLQNERSARRFRALLGAALALLVGSGAVAAAQVAREPATPVAALRLEIDELSSRQRTLLTERLAELDARHRDLRTRLARLDPAPSAVTLAKDHAGAARERLDTETLTPSTLTSFAEKLDALAAVVDQEAARARLADLDEAHARLRDALPKQPTGAVQTTARAAEAARDAVRANGADTTRLAGFDESLRALAVAIAVPEPKASPGATRVATDRTLPPVVPTEAPCLHPKDPMCFDLGTGARRP